MAASTFEDNTLPRGGIDDDVVGTEVDTGETACSGTLRDQRRCLGRAEKRGAEQIHFLKFVRNAIHSGRLLFAARRGSERANSL